MLREGDPILSLHAEPEEDLLYGSYGLDQCVDLARNALARGAERGADGRDLDEHWLIGEGTALSMIATVPPRGHYSHSTIESLGDGTFLLEGRHRRVRQRHLHRAHAAGGRCAGNHRGIAWSCGNPTPGSPTTTPVRSARPEPSWPARRPLPRRRSWPCSFGKSRRRSAGSPSQECVLVPAGVSCAGTLVPHADLLAAARPAGRHQAEGRWGGTPRSVAFNVHGFRVAVDSRTGELRILQSVQAADAGVVVNPRQCRGQIEGGIAQALGAALYEEVLIDEGGTVETDVLRQYHIPTFADVPRSEVYFAKTSDSLGPRGAKSMSESPFNPVAPALANAVRDATGIRFTRTPIRRDDIYLALRAAGKVPPLVLTEQVEVQDGINV